MVKEKTMSLEEKINLLEKLVGELEGEDVNLDESIEKYTRGIQLANEIDKELKAAEEKVSKLVTGNGELKDFNIDE